MSLSEFQGHASHQGVNSGAQLFQKWQLPLVLTTFDQAAAVYLPLEEQGILSFLSIVSLPSLSLKSLLCSIFFCVLKPQKISYQCTLLKHPQTFSLRSDIYQVLA
jgi:hypothetical protein